MAAWRMLFFGGFEPPVSHVQPEGSFSFDEPCRPLSVLPDGSSLTTVSVSDPTKACQSRPWPSEVWWLFAFE